MTGQRLIPKLIATALILSACVVAVSAGRRVWGPSGKVSAAVSDPTRAKGKPSAKLWVVEYMDYECRSCARVYPLLEGFLARYPGRLFVQIKFHPMAGHLHSHQAAIYALCASRQKAFWPYHELLLTRQPEWALLEDAAQAFRAYADAAAMDLAELDRCVSDPTTSEAVDAEFAEGRSLGVHATPSAFLNGKLHVGEKEISRALKEYFDQEKSA